MKKLVVILLITSSCATKLPDVPVCVEMSLSRGECINVVSAQKFTVDDTHKLYEKSWWDLRPTNIIIPAEAWKELKLFVVNMCNRKPGVCDSEVSDWDRSIEIIDKTQEKRSYEWPRENQ